MRWSAWSSGMSGEIVTTSPSATSSAVAVSYFEWVQDIQRLFWGPDEIRSRLADLMGDALSRVWDLSESEGLPFRRAALVTSIREVAEALEARGIHP